MPKIQAPPITLPRGSDAQLSEFQRTVVKAVQSLVSQMNQAVFTAEPAPATLDMGHNRVSNVAQPSAEGDAVNLGFLRRSFKAGATGGIRSATSDSHYQIVFGTPGDISTGTLVDFPYNVGIDRAGIPVEANISALSPPVGADIHVNFILYSGTSTTTLLLTDLVLTTGQTDLATANNFDGTPLQYGDRVVLSVTQVGSTDPGALVSIGLVVKPG